MTTTTSAQRLSLRLSASFLLSGQVFYIAVTQLHAGGHANDHHHIFAEYAESGIWTAVHLGQFVGMAILLAGFVALYSALEHQAGAVKWLAQLGAAAAAATLALYGVLQAVDGVALKHAVTAWAAAPDVEKGARFASAESIRWLEWGMRSYHDFAMGLTLILFAVAVKLTAFIPRPIAWLMGFSSLAYLAQGWVAGTVGFTSAQSIAIVLAWATSLVWMTWLVVVIWQMQEWKFESHGNGPATV